MPSQIWALSPCVKDHTIEQSRKMHFNAKISKVVNESFYKENGLLTRFFTKKKRAVVSEAVSPFFFGKKTG